ncbi:Uncharacterised protein [Flavonifractor plautii]|uniref:Uncharacterized protein n=1 Tax=Flavonifractor plautii TaxID=292800 RepID=A0A174F8E9_FLAPL|nr:Uncharacterised protein [Flavonifractor plautii]
MALVDEKDEILGEVVQQGVGGRAGGAALNDPAVVLNAGAVTQLLHHLYVVHGTLLDALGLNKLVVGLEEGHPLLQLPVDLLDGGVHLLLGGDIVGGGPDGDGLQPPDDRTGDHVDLADTVDLVAEELHPDGGVLPVGGEDLHRVPPHPEHVALKSDVVALIADGHQLFQQLLPLHLGSHPQGDHHLGEVLRLAQAVDAGYRGHHDHVPPLHQGGGGRQPQPVDLLVHRRVLLNEGVGVGDIGLGLVVVVVGHKILYRVVGEKFLKLGAELGRQGLVVGQHQGGPLHRLDDLGHSEGLARTGDAKKGSVPPGGIKKQGSRRIHPPGYAGGLIFADNLKFRHSAVSPHRSGNRNGGQPRAEARRRPAAFKRFAKQNLVQTEFSSVWRDRKTGLPADSSAGIRRRADIR